jgi:DNA repair protein RadD
LFAEVIKQAHEQQRDVLVLGHRDEIVQQICTALRRLNVRHGIIAPKYAPTDDLVQVASVFTAVRRLDKMVEPDVVIIDETHHAVAASWKKILEQIPAATLVLGVTATPRRLDGKPLDDIFEHLIVGPSIGKLIDGGFLAPATVFTPPESPDLKRVKVRAGDYAVDELSHVMSRGIIIETAVQEYTRLCPHAPAIAFCVDIAHSKLVAQAFIDAGYRAAHVDGTTQRKQRRDLIAALGDVEILCNCGLISEGLDVPGVVADILLRPTKSLSLYLQMVGRASRPADGKDMAYILDHAGNVYRHGLPTAHRRWTLHGKAPKQQDDNLLIRCKQCGAMNLRTALVCSACGVDLHPPHKPTGPTVRVEVTGRQLVKRCRRRSPMLSCK